MVWKWVRSDLWKSSDVLWGGNGEEFDVRARGRAPLVTASLNVGGGVELPIRRSGLAPIVPGMVVSSLMLSLLGPRSPGFLFDGECFRGDGAFFEHSINEKFLESLGVEAWSCHRYRVPIGDHGFKRMFKLLAEAVTL